MKNQHQPTITHRWENKIGIPALPQFSKPGWRRGREAKPHRDMNSETTKREKAARKHWAKRNSILKQKGLRNGLQLGLNHLLGSRKNVTVYT